MGKTMLKAASNTVRLLWQAQNHKIIKKNLSLDNRKLSNFALGATQQQYEID